MVAEAEILMRICPKCNETKPLTPDYWDATPVTRDGFHVRCKRCRDAPKRMTAIVSTINEYRLNSRITVSVLWKQCACCKEWKLANRVHWERSTSQDLGVSADCKSCLSLSKTGSHLICSKCHELKPATVEYFYPRRSNSFDPKCKACKKLQRTLNRDAIKERDKRYYVNNRDKLRAEGKLYRQKNRERELARYVAWRKQNRDKSSAYSRQRRALRYNAEGTHTAADIRLQVKSQTNKNGQLICWWCEQPIEGGYHIDHRIALSRGGSNNAENLCITCPTCNLSKSDKLPGEWNGRLL